MKNSEARRKIKAVENEERLYVDRVRNTFYDNEILQSYEMIVCDSSDIVKIVLYDLLGRIRFNL